MTTADGLVAPRLNWPAIIVEGAWPTADPVQPAGTFVLDDAVNGILDANTLADANTWSDLTAWVRSGSVVRAASRQQGPLWSYSGGTATVVLVNSDGRFDADNLAGPYVAGGASALQPMVPVRARVQWNGITYPLFSGFADGWVPEDGTNYGGRYAEATLSAQDAQLPLSGVRLPPCSPVGAGEASGSRVGRILDAAGWYEGTGQRRVAAGDSAVQAYTGGDSAWSLLQATADAEIGDLYIDASGRLVFRNRHAILLSPRSATVQAVLGDSAGTVEADGTEQPYYQVTRARDLATMANDVQATIVNGGTMQEAKDAASIRRYLFTKSYARSDLILEGDPDALSWAQWVLYVSKGDEDRFDQLVIYPLRDPANLWPLALGRDIGDRIQVWRRPPGVAPVVKDCFIRGIQHAWNWGAGTWATTWTLQDAAKYGSFFTLDNSILGRLDSNALTF